MSAGHGYEWCKFLVVEGTNQKIINAAIRHGVDYGEILRRGLNLALQDSSHIAETEDEGSKE